MNCFAILESRGRPRHLKRRGFTLVEFLVVLAVITILAAITYPVFSAAKESARQTSCLSSFRQASIGTSLYLSDYDDSYVVAAYEPTSRAASSSDRTWVQLLMPYMRSFPIFRCPSDYSDRPDNEAFFDEDLIPGDTYSRYYQASKRSNIGYNYIYLSPIVLAGNSRMRPMARTGSQVGDQSNTILFADSVWEIDEFGRPRGGGSYLIVPPCRYFGSVPPRIDTFMLNNIDDSMIFRAQDYWKVQFRSSSSFGGVYPWHRERATIALADGRVRPAKIAELMKGCNVQDNWSSGAILDRSSYQWDLE